MGRSNRNVIVDFTANADASDLNTLENQLNSVGAAFDSMGDDAKQASTKSDSLDKSFNDLESRLTKVESSTKELGTEVDNTKKDFNELETKLDDTDQSLKDVDGSSGDAESGFDKLGVAAAGAALAMGAMSIVNTIADNIGGLVDSIIEFDDQTRLLQARTGATAEEMASFDAIAQRVYASGRGETFADVIDAMSTVANITGLAGQDLEDFTDSALLMSQVFDKDVNESSRAANQLMTQFGISGTEAMDLIAQSIQSTGDPQDELLDTVNEYASTFSNVGDNADTMFGLINAGAEAGVYSNDKLVDSYREWSTRMLEGSDNVSEAYDDLIGQSDDFVLTFEDGSTRAITGFDEFQDRIAEGSISMADAMDMVGESLLDIEDPIERNRIAAELIGTQYEDLGDGILESFANADEGVTDATGTMARMGETIDGSLSSKIEGAKRAVELFLINGLAPLINEGFNVLIPVLETMGEWFTNDGIPVIEQFANQYMIPLVDILADLADEIVGLVTRNQAFLRWIGRAAAAVGVFVAMIASTGPILGAISAAFLGLGAIIAFLTSPIVLVIAALVALQAAYETNFLGFRDIVDSVVNFVVEKLGQLSAWFVSDGIPWIKGAIEDLGVVWDGLKTKIGELWATVKPHLDAMYNWFVTDGLPLMGQAVDGYLLYLTTMKNLLIGIWALVSPHLESMYNWFVTDGLPAMGTAVDAYIDYLTDVKNLLLGLWALVKPQLESMYNWFVTEGLPLVTSATNDLYLKVIALKNFMVTLWTLVKPELEKLYNWFVTDGMPLVTGAINDAKSAISLVQLILQNIWTNVSTNLTSFKDGIIAAFDAIKQPINDVLGILGDIANAILTLPSVPDDILGIGGAIGGLLGNDHFGTSWTGYAGGTSWTGRGGQLTPAGIVHKEEGVVKASGMTVHPDPSGFKLRGSLTAGFAGGAGGQQVIHNYVYLGERQVAYSVNRFNSENPQNAAVKRGNRMGRMGGR